MYILSNNQTSLNEVSAYKEFQYVSRSFKQIDLDTLIDYVELSKENKVTNRISLANATDQLFTIRAISDSLIKYGQVDQKYKTTTRRLYKLLNCGKALKDKADYKNLSVVLAQLSKIKFQGYQIVRFELKRNSSCTLEIFPGLFLFSQKYFQKKIKHCIQLNAKGCSIFNSLRTSNRALAIFFEDIYFNCRKKLCENISDNYLSKLLDERSNRLQKLFRSNSKKHVITPKEVERDGTKRLLQIYSNYDELINDITTAVLERKDKYGATLKTKYNIVKNQFSQPIVHSAINQEHQNSFILGEITC